MSDRIYWDYNATAPLAESVHAAMRPWLVGVPANPSSAHAAGQAARDAIERARASVQRLVGPGYRVVFTSGGTEADNLAVLGVLGWPPAGHALVSAIEHPAVIEPAARAVLLGAQVDAVPVSAHGVVDLAGLSGLIRDDTRLVSVMAANNELGTLQPIAEIGALLASHPALLHCDAVQAVAWIDLVDPLSTFDLVSLSSHKIGGPPGIGALAVREGVTLAPQLHGGGQQNGLRPGTEPTALAVGFGHACERVLARRAIEAARIGALHQELCASLAESFPDAHFTAGPVETLPNTLHVCLPDCDSSVLVARLDLEGVAVSAGSACASGVAHASGVLDALHLPASLAGGALRVSMGYGTRSDEVARGVTRLIRAVDGVRSNMASRTGAAS